MYKSTICVLWMLLMSSLALAAGSAEQETAAVVDAQIRLRQQILGTAIDPTWTVGAILQPCGGPEVLNGVLTRLEVPGGARWLNDQVCQVRGELSGEQVAEAIMAVVRASKNPPVDPAWLGQKLAAWKGTTFSAEGCNLPQASPAAAAGATSGTAGAGAAPGAGAAGAATTMPAPLFAPPAAMANMLPQQPPAWAFGLADAEGVAGAAGGPLKTGRAAELQARTVLRQQVRALEIYSGVTLGTVADRAPRIGRAVEMALQQARVYKTEYRADGSVLVRMSLNLRILWGELIAQQGS
jgi:hypothetical protein